MNLENKNTLIDKIKKHLKSKDDILFTYIFGSFALSYRSRLAEKMEFDKEQSLLNINSFKDIDVAIYLSKNNSESAGSSSLLSELELEEELENILHIPVDVRTINNAPLAFQYNVIKTGIIIIDNDINLRSDFEGLTFKKYFDFIHLRNEYLREIPNAAV